MDLAHLEGGDLRNLEAFNPFKIMSVLLKAFIKTHLLDKINNKITILCGTMLTSFDYHYRKNLESKGCLNCFLLKLGIWQQKQLT